MSLIFIKSGSAGPAEAPILFHLRLVYYYIMGAFVTTPLRTCDMRLQITLEARQALLYKCKWKTQNNTEQYNSDIIRNMM